MEIMSRHRNGFVPSVGNATSNNNTIALIKVIPAIEWRKAILKTVPLDSD
jgi:hypothetical protein